MAIIWACVLNFQGLVPRLYVMYERLTGLLVSDLETFEKLKTMPYSPEFACRYSRYFDMLTWRRTLYILVVRFWDIDTLIICKFKVTVDILTSLFENLQSGKYPPGPSKDSISWDLQRGAEIAGRQRIPGLLRKKDLAQKEGGKNRTLPFSSFHLTIITTHKNAYPSNFGIFTHVECSSISGKNYYQLVEWWMFIFWNYYRCW